MIKNKEHNRFILFSRFDEIAMTLGDQTNFLSYKINDEAVRYDRIKKVYI